MFDKDEEIKKIEHKYVLKTFETRRDMTESEQLAYGLAWSQATKYFNEIMELHNQFVISQMTDDDFEEFLRKKMEE